MKDDRSGKKPGGWEDLVFSTLEKIATAPSKLKDPKETVIQAVDWIKGVRDDISEKITGEIKDKISQLDFNALAERIGDHLAENYDVEVTAKISLRPKNKSATRPARPKKEKPNDESSSTPSEEV